MDGDRLDEDQIALVIRRATELDGQTLAGQSGLDLVLLEQAAVEAGLSRQSVRRAVAELRAGTLAVEPGDSGHRRRARLGPSTVTVDRCVPGPAAEVDAILRQFLQRELFHLQRDLGAHSAWSRRQDVGARVRISYDKSIHRRLRLRDAEHVDIAVVEEPGSDGRLVVVKMAVDVRPLRRVHRVALGKGVVAGGALAAVGLAVLTTPEALVAMPVAAGAGVAAGHAIGSSRYRSLVDEVTVALEGFLDGIERRPAQPGGAGF
ncbi:MAG TPA: hypothetical protein VHT97_10135 [Acidimicrobiales bacterium]|nr:hypothetical protein [Acidimicrobiales bacterium]